MSSYLSSFSNSSHAKWLKKERAYTLLTSSPCDVKEAVAGVVQPVRRVRRDVAGEGRRERHAGAGAAQRAAAGRAARGRQGLRA